MRKIINVLTFVCSYCGVLLPCHGQFNTISRDTASIRLIEQPFFPERMRTSSRESIGKTEEVRDSRKSQVSFSDEQVNAPVNETTLKGEKYYEMPDEFFDRQGKVSWNDAVVSIDGYSGIPVGSSEDLRTLSGRYEAKQNVPVLQEQREGKKSWSFWPFKKSSTKSGSHSRRLFGKKRRQAPQVIIMPIQTVGDNLSSEGTNDKKGRVRIDEYIENSGDDIFFKELKEEDLRRLDLLSQRSTVSMPLQRFSVSSKFGYRKDPLGQGTRFHDGVDLRCSYEPVFAMLPGVVTKVQYGSTGYGNYVVLNHGNIECLYGHLSDIGVEVGEGVQAGDVVAISGNTGRSTGPHLHVKMTYMGQRVDPLVFIDYINDYIYQLQSELYGGNSSHDFLGGSDLNVENLITAMEHYGLHHQSVVLAQALLETGWFTSAVCRNKHNLFGLMRRDGNYYEFDTWQDSVKGYRDLIQYRYKGGDYYEFLRNVPYAEDPNYIYKVKQIEGQLGSIGIGLGEGGE